MNHEGPPRGEDGPRLAPPRRLLVRGVNWLGDAVMSTPALMRLRQALPTTHITLLTAAKLSALWPGHPAIDEVVTFGSGEGAWTVGRRLWAGRFDAALVLPNSPRSALESFLAGIPVRVGYARPWRRWLLTRRVPPRAAAVRMVKPSAAEVRSWLAGTSARPGGRFRPPPEAHHTLEYLGLAAEFGASPAAMAPKLAVFAPEVAEVRSKFGLAEGTAWLGLNPGAEYGPAKRWPAERFAAAARAVAAAEPRVRWVVVGGANDRVIAEGIAAAIPGALNLAGVTSLRELMAVLGICRVVLTNDTGPMHVAAAMGVPVVVPFGSTSPELTGPGLVGDPRHVWVRVEDEAVPCAPCFLRECPVDFRCMTGVTADRVAAAVRSRISVD